MGVSLTVDNKTNEGGSASHRHRHRHQRIVGDGDEEGDYIKIDTVVDAYDRDLQTTTPATEAPTTDEEEEYALWSTEAPTEEEEYTLWENIGYGTASVLIFAFVFWQFKKCCDGCCQGGGGGGGGGSSSSSNHDQQQKDAEAAAKKHQNECEGTHTVFDLQILVILIFEQLTVSPQLERVIDGTLHWEIMFSTKRY